MVVDLDRLCVLFDPQRHSLWLCLGRINDNERTELVGCSALPSQTKALSMNAKTRFGSAHFATSQEVAKAGLVNNGGLHQGFTDEKKRRQIGFDADTATIVLGAAGSGKLTTHVAYQMLAENRTVILDQKGEIAATTVMMQPWADIYCFNPYGLWREKPWFLPHHCFNPLDMLDSNSPTFFEDALTLATNLIDKPKGGGNGTSEHFHGKAVQIAHVGILCLKEFNPNASLIDLYHFIGDIRGGCEADYLSELHYPAMKASAYPSVQQMADELMSKRNTAPAEFESILSTVSNSLQILGSPALQMALSGQSDITAEQFCQPDKSRRFFIIIPAHLMTACAPVIRCIFSAFTIQQQRKPLGRLNLIIDEAAQLGKFEEILRMFAYGRGSKTRVSAIFQNHGQIVENFGQQGTDTLLGNAQTKLILGVASEQSARFVSDYLGKSTNLFDPYIKQYSAETKRMDLLRKAIDDGTVVQSLPGIWREHETMQTPEAVARPLMTPDEVMHLPTDTGIVSFHGLGIRPYKYRKIPYFENKAVAHLFLPNPFHAPFDSISVPGWFGRRKTIPLVTEPVPSAISHLPQYAVGQWSYPKGHHPLKRRWWQFFSRWK